MRSYVVRHGVRMLSYSLGTSMRYRLRHSASTMTKIQPSTTSSMRGSNVTTSTNIHNMSFFLPQHRNMSTTSIDTSTKMCNLAAEGNIKELKAMVNAGADINCADYDLRTPTHIAASEGRLDVVQFLVSSGANVNAVDKFGGTPLVDAIKGRYTEVAKYLRQHGSKVAVSFESELSHKLCTAAAHNDVSTLQQLVAGYGDESVNISNYDGRNPLHIAASSGHLEAVKFLVSSGANMNAHDRYGNTPVAEAARHNYVQLVDFFSTDKSAQGTFELTSSSSKFPEHMQKVSNLLRDGDGTFSASILHSELNAYYGQLDLHPFYFERFSPEEVATHIKSYIAAKYLAAASGNPENIQLFIEKSDGTNAFYLTTDTHVNIKNSERSIDSYTNSVLKMNPASAFSVTHFISKGTAVAQGLNHLAMHIVDVSEFVNPNVHPSETDINKVATKNFLTTKPNEVKQRYQQVMEETVARISPLLKVFPRYRDDTIPLMFAFRRDSLSMSMWEYGELFESMDILCERKMVEMFSNGINVYSMYLHPRAERDIEDIINQVSLLFLAPKTKDITPLYLSGELGVKEYVYASTARRFVYYFMHQNNEDLAYLYENLKGDSNALQRLQSLRSNIKRDVISEDRISQTIIQYPDLLKAIFSDFVSKTEPGVTPRKPNTPAEPDSDLLNLINKKTLSELDRSILNEFVRFNCSVLKTNFWKVRKAALSFRLHPSCLSTETFGDTPYGIFMMCGNDFHGFHVRFDDVSRGGVRLIKSNNSLAYASNHELLFWENYNLALTQNKKNKDIPEFGSKGTILLHRGNAQEHREKAFHKYTSAMLDLIILNNNNIVDHYGKPEIIFLGPDENTADVMEWAALYSKRRGYPYWKAFTTGKPPSLGGIPHDVYGMTTSSVHKFVTETLHEQGENESNISKLQTGGPDGDLGSNEILLSKDITCGIVDGSGVLCDPKGIDRTELNRLAKDRLTVSHFNGTLSEEGFRVLVEDRDLKLPNGQIVENGVIFRNEFHLNDLSSADLFVPCGGRPESVTSKNVHLLFNSKGQPRFKYIVEGANLFFTQDARDVLANAGVVLFKDASANKGGVTSSSMEVLAALVLTDEEFSEHMSVPEKGLVPPFYKAYVAQVLERVRQNAFDEFHCIEREFKRTGAMRHVLTDEVSDKINVLNNSISRSNLYESSELRTRVLSETIPGTLIDLIPGGLPTILERLPEAYTQALFKATIASQYVYRYGLAADEFAFHEYLTKYLNKPERV